MTLETFYEEVQGDYQAIKNRLMKEDLIKRLVIKFLADPSHERLLQAMENNDYDIAFLAAHSMKGVCQNLEFQVLAKSSSELTELLRNRETVPVDIERCKILVEQVEKDYQKVVNAISKLDE